MPRPLSPKEVSALESHGCSAADWSLVTTGDRPLATGRVRNAHFRGRVHLGAFAGDVELEPGVRLPSGVRGASLEDAWVGDGALVADCVAVVRVRVGAGAALAGCGVVCGSEGGSACGAGLRVRVGPSVGGRELVCMPESLLESLLATPPPPPPPPQPVHPQTVIGDRAVLLRCPRVCDVVVGAHARLVGSTVEEAHVLSAADEPSAVEQSCVERSLLQRGVRVRAGSVVRGSLLCEYSSADRNAVVMSSVLGPDTGVAEGECSYSLVGPHVGMSHHSLLIATVWPEGKGNVGAGANVGSNHTGKAPDQELRAGEGCFFGLGVNIKYPSNFEEAPHTVFATGVTALAQRLRMPFSLVNAPAARIEGLSPAINEITPAWVLRDNVFAVLRNEHKFRQRTRARRHRVCPDVLHDATVQAMERAVALLRAARPPRLATPAGEPVYTDREVAGLGKNFVTAGNLQAAVETYEWFIRLYALRGAATEYQRALRARRPEEDGEYQAMLRLLAERAEASKAKDAKRGRKIIDDYDEVHVAAADEPVVQRARRACRL